MSTKSVSTPSSNSQLPQSIGDGNGHTPILLQHPKLLTNREINDFNTKFTELVQVLTHDPDLADMDDTNKWLERVLEYNVPHGKKNR